MTVNLVFLPTSEIWDMVVLSYDMTAKVIRYLYLFFSFGIILDKESLVFRIESSQREPSQCVTPPPNYFPIVIESTNRMTVTVEWRD